jgi:hypothetical protein
MIAEPYICIKGFNAGFIEWSKDGRMVNDNGDNLTGQWIPYADFEREKLKELSRHDTREPQYSEWKLFSGPHSDKGAFKICHTMSEFPCARTCAGSGELIGYTGEHFKADSESNRLLKRAEFLKAVCEKEGVEWLPTEKPEECCECENGKVKYWHKTEKDVHWLTDCPCDCHKPAPQTCECQRCSRCHKLV